MKRLLPYSSSCLLLLYSLSVSAQNLLMNGSFEEENICTEYHKNCAPEAWMATSLWSNYYFDEPGQAQEGTHFIGLTAGNILTPGVRNFIRAPLLCGMRKGARYILSFYVRAKQPVLDSIGVYFSGNDYLYEKKSFKMITPQLWTTNRDTASPSGNNQWSRIELMHTASGDESFLTIGNFKRIDYTGIQKAEYRADYYFFLDNISLVPEDKREILCTGADSVKKAAYADDLRHDLLNKRMYLYRRKPTEYVRLPPTSIVPLQVVDTLIIPDLFFATASYRLSANSFRVLDSFAQRMAAYQIDSLVIEGHTDSVGKLAYNLELSLNRALAVQHYLSERVPAAGAVAASRGFAFLKPVASNRNQEGRQLNRRVAVLLYRKETVLPGAGK